MPLNASVQPFLLSTLGGQFSDGVPIAVTTLRQMTDMPATNWTSTLLEVHWSFSNHSAVTARIDADTFDVFVRFR